MKKVFAVLFSSVILTSSMFHLNVSAIDTNRQYEITDASVAVFFFDDVMSKEEWISNENRMERGKMLQLPDDMLQEMSTDALVEAILEYPFLVDIYAFDDVQTGIDTLYDSFNGYRELCDRSDAAETILKKYELEPVLNEDNFTSDSDILRLTYIEMLASQKFVIDNLDADGIKKISTVSCQKYYSKKDSALYGDFDTDLFFKMNGINPDSKNLESVTASVLSSYSSTVTTPKGSSVPVTVYTSEPLTTAKIEELNKSFDEGYPTATRLGSASGKYNCHSYVWYWQSTSNNCVMQDPTKYIDDGSFKWVSNAYCGCRIIYVSNSEYLPIHSASVQKVLSGPTLYNYVDLSIVRSKWGQGGLYEHSALNCPSMAKTDSVGILNYYFT